MILKILGLPPDISKIDIRELIQQKCGLSELLLDELCLDGDGSQRVTVGCQDERDGGIVVRQLHRTKLGSYTISVAPFRPNRSDRVNEEFTRIDQEYYRTQKLMDTIDHNVPSDFRASSYEESKNRAFSQNGDEYYQKYDNTNMIRDGSSSELRNRNFTEPVNREFSRKDDEFYKKYDAMNTSSDFRNSNFTEPMDKEFFRKEHTTSYQNYDTVNRTRDHSSNDFRETNFNARDNRELYKNDDQMIKTTRDPSSGIDRISHFTASGLMNVSQSNSTQGYPPSDAQPWGQIVVPEAAPWGKVTLPETAPWGKIVLPETAPWGKIVVPETAPWGKVVLPEAAPWGKIVLPESETLYQPRTSRWDIQNVSSFHAKQKAVPGTPDGWQSKMYLQQIQAMQVLNEKSGPQGPSPEKGFNAASRDFHPTEPPKRSRWDHSHPDTSLKRQSLNSDGFRTFDSPGNDRFAQRKRNDHPESTTSSFEPQQWRNSNRDEVSSAVRYPDNRKRPFDAFKSGPSWGNQKRPELQARNNRQSSPVQHRSQDKEPGQDTDVLISKATNIITQKILIKESSHIYTYVANPESITNDLREAIGGRLQKIVDPSTPMTIGRLVRLYGETYNASTDTRLVEQVLVRRKSTGQARGAENQVAKELNKKEFKKIDVSVKIWKDYASLILANEIFEKAQSKLLTPKPERAMHAERKFVKSKLTSMIMERMDKLKPAVADNITSAKSMKSMYRQTYPEATDEELVSAVALELSKRPTGTTSYPVRDPELKVTLTPQMMTMLEKATNEICLDHRNIKGLEMGKVLMRLRNLAYEHHAGLKRIDDVMKMYYNIFNKNNDRVMLARETKMVIEQGSGFYVADPDMSTSEFLWIGSIVNNIVEPMFVKAGIYAKKLKRDIRKVYRERIMNLMKYKHKRLTALEILKLYNDKYTSLSDKRMIDQMKKKWADARDEAMGVNNIEKNADDKGEEDKGEAAHNESVNVDDIEINMDDLEDY